MAKKKSTAAPKFNHHVFAELSLQVEECADTLRLAEEDGQTISHDHQERLTGVVRLVTRDLDRLQNRLSSLYDGEVAS